MNIQSVVSTYGVKSYEPTTIKSGRKNPIESSKGVIEQVEFSDTSLNLQKVRELVNATPDVRIQKVEEIKEKIKHNAYPIESAFYKAIENMVKQKIL